MARYPLQYRDKKKRGPRWNPAERFQWGEEEQGSGRSFRQQPETELSGLCDDEMEYTVSATDLANIQLKEEDRVKEILRNVAVILATPKGSVPMYRSFGLDMSFLDKPMNIAKNLAVIPVKEAIEEWEPRAEYKDITLFFDPSNPGKLAFTVQIEIKAGE